MTVALSERRKQLILLQKDLQTRLVQIEDELESHQSKDWADRAIEREDDEVLERMGNSGQAELAMIASALQRMDEGEYGICVKCGNEISEDRLDVLPFTPFCRRCAP